MSDEFDLGGFEGGFLGEADVNPNEIPDDPFGFGNEFWPVIVLEVGEAKVTANKDKIGMMVKFAVDHPNYSTHFVSKGLGNGNWYQLPVPIALRSQIPWENGGDKEKIALYKLGELFGALGFPKDQWKGVNGAKMVGKRMFAKIKVTQDEKGFWQFRFPQVKSIPEGTDTGWGEYSEGTTSNPARTGKTDAELLEEEMNNA